MYKVKLINENEILKSKEFKEYDDAYEYSNSLIREIKNNYKVLLLEYKENDWKIIRSLSLEGTLQ